MTSLELLNSYLGIEVKQCETHITLRQNTYAKRILMNFEMNLHVYAKTLLELTLRSRNVEKVKKTTQPNLEV